MITSVHRSLQTKRRNHAELARVDDQCHVQKGGGPPSPSNYRPISSIHILYELSSELLFRRLHITLDAYQSAVYSLTVEAFLVHLRQNGPEWLQNLRIAAIDLKKVFGTVGDSDIWKSLREQGIAEPYVEMLTQPRR